ncbi:MAG: hypothetical protein J7M14_03930 [Planctomycetes bacterium]|nr:hypothetical protein [Planctomycetota bacterium]
MNKSLLREFADPPSRYRGKPFWAWNGKLEPQHLRRQIGVMHEMGLGGFFMHSRVGLDTPYLSDEWFECIDACIDEAGKLGMEAWLYDEDRWPSGAAGGLVTRKAEFRRRSLVMRELKSTAALKWSKNILAAFTAAVDGAHANDVKRIARNKHPRKLPKGRTILVFTVRIDPPSSWYNGNTYLDTMNPKAVEEFIRVTHEAYRKRCGRHFSKTIPGIFTDEPNYGTALGKGVIEADKADGAVQVPWTGKLPAVFRKRYGFDIIDHLVEVFLDVDGRAVSPTRWAYFDCITHMFVDAFARQVGLWCDKHNMQYTGHVLGEETLSSETAVVGSPMRFLEHMQAPGMDLLTEIRREYDTAKQVSSVARQFGRKWRLSETYGTSGWQFPLVGHKAVGDWQAALGINLRCHHLSWYTMEGQAKRDYPASILDHSPWWRIYPKVEDYFARVHVAMTRGSEVRDLLVIHPVESMWTLCRRGWREDPRTGKYDQMLIDLRDSLLAGNIDFDYGDEDILARHGKVARMAGQVVLKVAKATYKAVVVPPMVTIRGSTVDLLERFRAAGGKIVFAGKAPQYVDARPSGAASALARECAHAPAKGKALPAAVEVARQISIIDGDGNQIAPTLYLLRQDKEAFYLFVCNTGYDWTRRQFRGVADIPVAKRTARFENVRIRGSFGGALGRPIELDADTGEIFSADAKRSDGQWEIRTSLEALGSRLFVIPRSKTSLRPPKRKVLKNVRSQSLGRGPWNITLSEANCLVLDRPRYKIGHGPWRKADEILRVDHAVRDALGVPRRGGRMVQPWARRKAENPPKIPVTLSYAFNVKAVPSGELFLAIERPQLFGVSLNGADVNPDAECGWWVDRSCRRLGLDASMLRTGRNEITLTCHYDENHPGLEIIYLLGAFGTKVSGTSVSMTAPPKSLMVGDWARQGLAFYGGAVRYCRTIRAKLRKGQRLFVRVRGYEGAAVRVLVDGCVAGVIAWEPNEVEITRFAGAAPVDLQIEVISHRHNSHGPLHLADELPTWIGPGQFGGAGKWTDAYRLVRCGLTAPPVLITRQ